MRTPLTVLSVLALAGCGAGTSASPASPAGAVSPGQSITTPQGFGASGLLAAINGHTLQVQDTTSQTAVTYSGTTRFTDTIAATARDVKVGTCVQVRSAPDTASSTPTTAPTAAPTSLTAGTVTLTASVNGTCGGPGIGGGGFTGGRGNGVPPSRAPGARRARFGGRASGLVTAVQGSSFTVASTRPNRPTPTPVRVTTTSTTSYHRVVPASATALKLGQCVTARGPADSTGTVAATTIALRPADNGTCTSGFGGGFGGRGGRGA
jgi:hypothetical protein